MDARDIVIVFLLICLACMFLLVSRLMAMVGQTHRMLFAALERRADELTNALEAESQEKSSRVM